jgi:hypothetical protein
MRFDPALKKALRLCSKLGGKKMVDLADADISIKWQDGLPGDPFEEAQIMDIRSGRKPTRSVYSLIRDNDGLSKEDAIDELERIQEEEAAANPMVPNALDGAGVSGDAGNVPAEGSGYTESGLPKRTDYADKRNY